MLIDAVVGILIVFLLLILLSFCIYLFGKIMNINNNGKLKVPKQPQVEKVEVELDAPQTTQVNDDELVAVITAAVNAYLDQNGLKPQCEIRVRAFQRVDSDSPVWNKTNKDELINSTI